MRTSAAGVLSLLVLTAGGLCFAPSESSAKDDSVEVRELKARIGELEEAFRKQAVVVQRLQDKLEAEQRARTTDLNRLQSQLAQAHERANHDAVKLVNAEQRLVQALAAQHAARVDSATLRARLTIARRFEEKFRPAHLALVAHAQTDFANAQKAYEQLAARWKKRAEIAEDRIDVLEKDLPPTHEALRRSEEGRRRDVMQLQQHLSEANERGNRNAIHKIRSSDPILLVLRERLASLREWMVGIIARVGQPVLPGLLDDLEADPEEYGRWVIPALARMGPLAAEAAPLLRKIADDPAMKSGPLAALAQEALDAIRGK